MKVKVHWVIDGIAEVEAESLEDAEKIVNEKLSDFVGSNPDIEKKWVQRQFRARVICLDLKRTPNLFLLIARFEPIQGRNVAKFSFFGILLFRMFTIDVGISNLLPLAEKQYIVNPWLSELFFFLTAFTTFISAEVSK